MKRMTLRRVSTTAILFVGACLAGASEGDVALAPSGKQPRVAIGENGLVAVVYGQGNEIFSRVSSNGGVSYADPVRVGEVERLMLGRRRGPQVAASGSTLVVAAIGRTHGDIVAWRSNDAGRTWLGPIVVNDSPKAAREGLHSVAAAGGGAFQVVWLDMRAEHTKVFAARSSGDRGGWDANRLVYESPDGTVCECCQPTIAADNAGNVAVMWRNVVAGARDMYLVRSSDGGRTFGSAEKLGTGTWPLQGCPMDGGGAAISGKTAATIWRREATVYAAAPGGAEETLGPGRNGTVATTPAATVMAWESPEGEVLLKTSTSQASAVARGQSPSLAAAADGHGPIVLAWEDVERGVMARVVTPEHPAYGIRPAN